MASLLPNANADDCEIKPGIAEMIREEERVSSTQMNNFLSSFYINFHVVVGWFERKEKTKSISFEMSSMRAMWFMCAQRAHI